MKTRKVFLQMHRRIWGSILLVFMSLTVSATDNEISVLQEEATKGNIEQMEIKSLDDVLLVFDGSVVSPKQFKKQ